MDDQTQKALALLGAVLSPGTTIASLGLQSLMPPRDEFENSLFSRLITDSQGKPQRNKMGEMEILPEQTMEGAFWKKSSPRLPRFLKPETKLSPVTQQRLAEEMVRAVSMTKDPTQQAAKGKVALELINKLPGMSGKPVSGAEIQEIAKGSGSTLKSKGEVNGLRLLHNALTNKSIYHGVKTPEGRNTLWQEMYKPKAEAQEVRNAMVDRRVQKGVATPEEQNEYQIRMNSQRDPLEAMMETLRMMGKLPEK